jgi:monoamine oxidase
MIMSNYSARSDPPLDTIVVGAGITGLRCAVGLVAAGQRVVVLEARDRVGGRLWTAPSDPSAPAVDLGATWFWPQEPRVQSLIEELGISVHPQRLEGDAVYEDPIGVQRLKGNPIDGPSGRFSPGAQALAEALAARLPEGALQTSSPVRRLTVADAGVEVGVGGTTLRAERAVVAFPPALAAADIAFDPALPEPLATVAAATPVWMGSTAKVVLRYSRPFWRERGLAGAAVSHRGPLREIHDMSGPGGDPAALFGFASAPGPGPEGELSPRLVTEQLVRLFGPEAAEPESIQIVDWSREEWTSPAPPAPIPGGGLVGREASSSDPRPGTATPRYDLYGHPAFQTAVHGRIHLASTETARAFAGHIEGALMAADETAERILSA